MNLLSLGWSSWPVKCLVNSVRSPFQVHLCEQYSQKENKNGVMSPEAEDPEPEFNLTPRTEAKFNKIEDDFQTMLQRNQMAQARGMGGGGGGGGGGGAGGGGGSANDYTIPVSVPVPAGGGSYVGDSALFKASPQVSHATISPRPSSSEPDTGSYCEY